MTTTLRHGDRSQAVHDLQRLLNQQGANLTVNGYFGDTTEAAVRAYQLRVGLVADGIAGAKTLTSLQGGDCTALLRNADLLAAAERLDVPAASVQALNEVESKGQGFLANGKPTILYERHIMYRRLQAAAANEQDPDASRQRAEQLAREQPALVNPKPGGYAGGTAEHQRLAHARLIDDTCALEATSWGAFQIMGFHWQRLGYVSVQAFVAAMHASESQQFEAFVRFIETDAALHKALKARQWAKVAALYNGPDYQRNLYDIKLQRAYQRHADCAHEAGVA
ncbi:N-acetylmuramidase domain-containing protein [Pseudomonas cremoricolorata]|uniref:N-acetylmuramidase domain-containing protein n=1 Tax=Pseudomonas cremoricolorata TaxID=157783 RepID=UPI000419052D|nr:N-acetylmuramidase family protein [Pseudomonas cremoricolorata]